MRKKYDFYSFCLIPALTLLLASGFGLTTTNFSVIGNNGGRRLAFLLWGAFTGNYFHLYTEALLELTGCRDRLLRGFLLGALILFITAVGLPYLPSIVPELSRLHVLVSFFAPLSLGMAQIRFLILLGREHGPVFGVQWSLLLFLFLGASVLFFSVGIVTSLLEIFITLGVCLYLRGLHKKIEKIRDNL